MKKTIGILAIAFCLTTQANAQTDSSKTVKQGTTTKYVYYPQSNVYYNEVNGNYSYLDATTNEWKTNQQLPPTMKFDKSSSHNTVDFNGTDVWRENATHQKKYGIINTPGSTTPKP